MTAFRNHTAVLAAILVFTGYHVLSSAALGDLNSRLAPHRILDARFPFADGILPWTPQSADTALRALEAEGRALYHRYLLLFDLPFSVVIMPACFAAVLSSLWQGQWVLVAFVPAVFDTVENTFVLVLLAQHPVENATLGWLGGLSTLFKWCSVVAVLALIAIGLVRVVRAKYQRRI
ncbi:MAG: hypothetical protein AAF801_00385 [Pseudomonadota bacterium]